MNEQDRRITETFERERGRLKSFIRSRVRSLEDAEDVLQDVFSALVEASRLLSPIEEVGAWLFRVARNRIIDEFRRKRPLPLEEGGGVAALEDLLPSPDAGPEAAYARSLLLEELEAALEELIKKENEEREQAKKTAKPLFDESMLDADTEEPKEEKVKLTEAALFRDIAEVEAEEGKAEDATDNPSAEIVEAAVEGAAPAEETANRDLNAVGEEAVQDAGTEEEKDANE